MKLIDKDRIVVEIEKRIKELQNLDKENEEKSDSIQKAAILLCIEECRVILSLFNTLEVKEVDLDKEVESLIKSSTWRFADKEDFLRVAKHFFQLGLSASNPITAADRGTAEEIIFNLKRVEQDYRIDLTREIEWLRNKVKG